MGEVIKMDFNDELVLVRNEGVFTTSLAVAEGTGNQHKNVMEMIRKYEPDIAEFGRVAFETQPFETAGGVQQREVALLNEHQATFILALSRNSPVVVLFKKRLVKAFFEMAGRLANPFRQQIPRNLPEALRLAAELAEETARQREQIENMIPKVEALDRIATADGTMCISNAAKDLQIRPKDLFSLLSSRQWIYRRAGSGVWTAYQDKLQQGLLEHKVTTVSRADGTEKITEQVLITAKGLSRLAVMLQGSHEPAKKRPSAAE